MSKSGVLRFWALGTRIIEPDGSNSGKMLSKAWLTRALEGGAKMPTPPVFRG